MLVHLDSVVGSGNLLVGFDVRIFIFLGLARCDGRIYYSMLLHKSLVSRKWTRFRTIQTDLNPSSVSLRCRSSFLSLPIRQIGRAP